MYKCKQCGYSAETAGMCPTCNAPTEIAELVSETPSEQQSTQEAPASTQSVSNDPAGQNETA